MIRELPESGGRVIGVEVTGRVSLEEEKRWIAILEQAAEEYGSFSAVVVLGENAGWDAKAKIEDLKWLLGHQIEIDRIALVADGAFWKVFTALDVPFAKLLGIQEKRFDHAQLDEAWAWVRGGKE